MDVLQEALKANQKIAEEAFASRLAALNITKPKELGFSLLSINETKDETGFCKGTGAIKIDYHDIHGRPTGFCRYRFLGQFEGFKYFQTPGSGVHAYLSKLIDWESSLKDITQPLIITEGEFKATQGCKVGYPTIGLGGVSNTSKEIEGYRTLIDPFNSMPPGKKVYICFDYDGSGDGQPKDQVALAETQLACALKLRGYDVRLIRLGEKGNLQKIGLDDFIQNGGSLVLKIAQAIKFIPLKRDSTLYLLSKYAIVGGDIVDIESGIAYNQQKFFVQEANCASFIGLDGKEIPAAKAFLTNPQRTTLKNFTFNPGWPGVITSDFSLNLWRGVKTIPMEGDISQWEEFLGLFFSAEPHMQEAFEQVIAYMFQNPGVRQNKLLILQSPFEGIGKSFYFETIAAIMNDKPRGENNSAFDHAVVATGQDLTADFNSLIKAKRFIVFNEIGEKGEKHTNLLKNLVTAPTLTLNEKFVRQYTLPNYLQICITTNDAYTHAINIDSRREIIYSIPFYSNVGSHLKEFFAANAKFLKWINTTEARRALYYRYLHMDLSNFDVNKPAPKSEGKAAMVLGTTSDLDDYIVEENLREVWFIVPKLEVERFREVTKNSRIGSGTIRSRLADIGFTKAPYTDATQGQAIFTSLPGHDAPPKALARPVVWANKAANVQSVPKIVMYEYLYDRYFGTRKL